jgi:hypothetical protein
MRLGLPAIWRLQGRCAAVVMYRHQLAVLPAMREDDSAVLPFFGWPELAEGAPANGPGSHPRAELPGGAGSGSGSGPFGPGGPPPAVAATLGNSYVDNLAKAGIKEVRE